MNNLEKIIFRTEDEEEVEFFVLEQTRIGGYNYLLVTDTDEEEGDALILKDLSKDTEEESRYEQVTDNREMDAVVTVFEKMLDDVDFVQDEE